jgi:hypothetical protein
MRLTRPALSGFIAVPDGVSEVAGIDKDQVEIHVVAGASY